MRTLTLRTNGPDDTRRLAATVAGALQAGDVIALTGELGAGKTCFVQGAAGALGVTGRVTSPSFILRRDYQGRLPVLHLDVYRLDTLSDVVELGYDEVLDGTRVTFIEWGDAMSTLLPPDHLEVEFHLTKPDGHVDGQARSEAPDDGAEPRELLLRPRGEDWCRRLHALVPELERWAA